VIASGGGAKSRVWLQILADVFEREVRTHKHGEDASAVGAAIVAGFACGFWRSIEDAAKRIPVETTTLPRTDNTGIYRDLFGIYRSLHRSLKPDFDRLGSVLARD
jgi:xylulokinase